MIKLNRLYLLLDLYFLSKQTEVTLWHEKRRRSPIDLKTAEKAQGFGMKALQVVKRHKKEYIIIADGASAVFTGALAYNTIKTVSQKWLSFYGMPLTATNYLRR